MKIILPIFFLLTGFVSQAQDCFNEIIPFQKGVYIRNKVKQMHIIEARVDTNHRRLAGDYFFHKNGNIWRNARYTSHNIARTETDCECTIDSLRKTKRANSFDQLGNKIELTRTIVEYDKSRRKIMFSDESLMGNYYRYIARFNPADTTETYIETIAFEGKDTARHNINKQNSKGFWLTQVEKTNGIRTVSKTVVTYKNGKAVLFEEFKDGKLVSSRPGKEDELAMVRKAVDPETANALPYTYMVHTDTMKVQFKSLQQHYQWYLDKRFINEPLTQVRIYMDNKKTDPVELQLYYANGLPAVTHPLSVDSFTLYEYIMFEPEKIKAPGKTKGR